MILSGGLSGSTPTDIIFAVLGSIALVASSVAVVRASLTKAQLEALRGDRDDLLERVNIVESENSRLKHQLNEEVTNRKALEKVVTAREEISKITTILTNHDARAIKLEKLMENIASKVGAEYG